VNLSVKKLRRGATVVGGTFLGLGIAAALATPALACDTIVDVDTTCATADGWSANWKVQNDYNPDAEVTSVKLNGVEVEGGVGDIKVHSILKANYKSALTATSKFAQTDKKETLTVSLHWLGTDINDDTSTTAKPKSKGCDSIPPGHPNPHPSDTSSSPAPSTSTTTGTPPVEDSTSPSGTPTETPTIPIPSESVPALPGEIYKADCTSVTIGLDNTGTPIEYKLTLKPKTGNTQELDIKPGEKKSATFGTSGSDKFSVALTLVAVYKGQTSPPETATIPYEKPASCSTEALAVTGSSTAPLAGGAVAVLLVGGGVFYMARRRKVRFTA
jgi:uncharacterized protein (TIGR04145 family)